MTSYATRTSPVIRGKWILENLLGTPPPPPPPDVPALKDNTVVGEPLRPRAAGRAPRQRRLRELPQPDGPGRLRRWRTSTRSAAGGRVEEGEPVDASGGLPDGSKFAGVPGSKQALLKRPELFVGTLDREAADVRARPRRRALRRPGDPQDRPRRAGAGLPLLVADRGDRQQHAVSDEDVTMIITKKALPRRTFLRGMGATLALPLLDAMVPADDRAGQDAGRPACAASASSSCRWAATSRAGRRRATDTLDELSPILSPLAPVKEHVTVITNLELRNAYPGTHATSNSAFLSAARAKRTESTDYYLGTTVDQIAAQQIGQETQLPSLELSMDLLQTVGQCDNGYACVYQNNLSWSSPTTPLPAEAHPRLVFERLFGEGGSTADRRAALQEAGQPARFGAGRDRPPAAASSGPADRAKVGQYLDTVREVERRIQKAEADAADNPLPDLDRPVGRAGRLRRPRPADVRPAGAGAAGRRHPRHHLPARARDQQPHLPRDRRPRPAPPALAPRQRPGEDRAGWRRSTRSTSRCSPSSSRS